MIKPPIDLQDLRRRIYVKAKAEPSWRFWGLYVHVCKRETLYEAYWLAKKNNGAPGVDGVTFEAIEAGGVDIFLEQLRDELVRGTYRPLRSRKRAIPKDGGKVRVLSIPAIRDRVVQGALKLILEPIFEADFPGSPVIRPTYLRRFRGGARRASPVARCALVAVPSLPPRRSVPPRQPRCDGPCCLRPTVGGSASGASHFRGHHCVHSRYGPVTRRPSRGWPCRWASGHSVSLLPAIRATGLRLLPRRD